MSTRNTLAHPYDSAETPETGQRIENLREIFQMAWSTYLASAALEEQMTIDDIPTQILSPKRRENIAAIKLLVSDRVRSVVLKIHDSCRFVCDSVIW